MWDETVLWVVEGSKEAMSMCAEKQKIQRKII